MKTHPSPIFAILRFCAALVVCSLCVIASANPPDMTAGQMPDLKDGKWGHTINLGPTGLWGWMYYEAQADSSKSRQILITRVEAGSPAADMVRPNDVILGASGEGGLPPLFAADARRSFAAAIATAEARDPASLVLLVWRDGKTHVVEIKLRTLGVYTQTAPYDCPKSARIFEEGVAHYFANEKSGIYQFGALALLASGKPEYLERVKAEAHSLIPNEEKRRHMLSDEPIDQSGKPGWNLGHSLVFLAEYYLATGDKEVLPAVEAYAVQIAKNHSMFGTLGHRMGDKNPDGSNNGPMGGHYGAVNSAAMPCFLGLVLASKCGLDHPEIGAGIRRCNTFYGFYAGRGNIPYGEHPPDPGHGGNGKSGSAALCFILQPDRADEGRFFAKMSVASAGEREIGHTGPYFSFFWSPLGANAGGPAAMAEHFHRIAWHLDLCRRWDGGFVFNNLYPEGPHSGGSYSNFPMANAVLLAYATPRRSLAITGRGIESDRWLSGREIAEAGAADDYRPQDRAFDALVGDLANWSPKVRDLAAKAIGSLKLDDSQIHRLQQIARGNDSSAGTRAAACMALGKLRHGGSAPILAALLTDPDSMVRYSAADALRYLPDEARRSVLDVILRATASTARPLFPLDPADPVQFAHGRLAVLLFYSGTAYGPKGILHKSIEGVDRALLYPAIRAVASNPIGLSRSTLYSTYQNLTKEDVLELADTILDSVIQRAPSDRMFSNGVRSGGVEILARHRIAEAIPAAVLYTMDDNKGIKPLLDAIKLYGGAITTFPHQPDVIEFLEMDFNKNVAGVADALATIKADTAPQPVVHLKGIDSITASPSELVLPVVSSSLRVESHSHLKSPCTFTWRKLEGPGEVNFSENGTAAAVRTLATFAAAPGKYVLEVTMTDEHGLTAVTGKVVVQVR